MYVPETPVLGETLTNKGALLVMENDAAHALLEQIALAGIACTLLVHASVVRKST